MMMTQKIAAAIITFTMLAGCVDSTGQGDSDEAEASSQPSPVILQADGIAQGEGFDLPYGTKKSEVIAMLERFGRVDQSNNEECGAGPMDFVSSSATGLTLNFQEGQLVGWFFDGDGKLARTAQDITVGSTRSDLEAALPIEMQTDSTLGIEFFSGSGENGFIAGFLSDESKNATVESLYSGTNCFFR
ncbi:aspartate-semialdehyde dehydrogenase [uncultured Parasphingorhabdus sp.]|uniref:aspartate-semialdehyde dehydrogenase n=1 Tax=uncultured Parasphingorhabdus sp. TaxID=2709694 RepID=UPI0030DDDCC4|tara:strand:- start:39241 stop:39804 length:564 start_codon:yes stop_codon:yes gene_type:complete